MQKAARRQKKTMSIDFTGLILIWLLPVTGSSTVTSGQDPNFTPVMAGEVGNKFTHEQLTTQELFSSTPISKVSGHNIRLSNTQHSLQTTSTTPSKTFLANIQTAPPLGINSSTEVTTSATTMESGHGSNPTITSRVPPVLNSSTQSLDTGKASTFQLTSDKMSHPSTRPTHSTNLISTTATFTKPVENKSTSRNPVTAGDAKESTKSSVAVTKTPFIHITTAKKRQDNLEKKAKPKEGTNHGKAVAGLIGGALILMMVGFLGIYIKKQKLQRQQVTTTDWAGPSPFLEGGADNSQVTLRSANRISLSSILPQRLSKRLSLLPETDEELEDMTPGTTFGDKHQGSSFGREVDGNIVKESTETAEVVLEMKSTGAA